MDRPEVGPPLARADIGDVLGGTGLGFLNALSGTGGAGLFPPHRYMLLLQITWVAVLSCHSCHRCLNLPCFLGFVKCS